MKTIRRDLVIAVFVALLPALFVMACQPADQQAPTPDAQETENLCPDSFPCGNDCGNTPNVYPDCWPTQYGPVQADVVVEGWDSKLSLPTPPKSMLYCTGGSYALCYFSGPPYATGHITKKDTLPPDPLPCLLDDNYANCTCKAYTASNTSGVPYFVLITGILNQGVYEETVNVCGSDGSRCKNLANCGDDPSTCSSKKPAAPVCNYINNQTSTDTTAIKFDPDADLISTFSFAMQSQYSYTDSTSCTSSAAKYGGCMTASCNFTPGNSLDVQGAPIQCACPTYTGPFQLTQGTQKCGPFSNSKDDTTYVWSASFSVDTTKTQ